MGVCKHDTPFLSFLFTSILSLLNQSASEMCADECGHLTTWCGLQEGDNEQVVGPLKTKLLFF